MPKLSIANLAERTPEGIRQEIRETEATIQKMNSAARRYQSSVRAQGVEIWKEVNHAGVVKMVKRLNPAVKRLRECETTIRALQRCLNRLRDEIKALEAQANEGKSLTDWLDSDNG